MFSVTCFFQFLNLADLLYLKMKIIHTLKRSYLHKILYHKPDKRDINEGNTPFSLKYDRARNYALLVSMCYNFFSCSVYMNS